MRFVNTITINRDPAAVFAYLAQFENLPQWNYAIAETQKITDGPVRVGARYRQLRTVPTRSEESFEVIEYEPDRRLMIRGQIGPLFGDISYILEHAGDGTMLTNAADLHAGGPLRLVEPLATRRVKSSAGANLRTLKQILEQG
jgi:carbon monoxide dehydrogenase subunit G